jgi:hypothetical protein
LVTINFAKRISLTLWSINPSNAQCVVPKTTAYQRIKDNVIAAITGNLQQSTFSFLSSTVCVTNQQPINIGTI